MKEFVCITCPNSCRMQAELENGQWKVTGNKCKRGQQFAESEMTCPKRTFSTTVKTAWDSVPVIPVRVSREIPKDKIFQIMEEINHMTVRKSMEMCIRDRHISLEVQCHEELTALHDPKWTAEAVGNLLDNAVKYTPDGGTVQVTVEPWQFYTKLTVSDTGIGIDESHYHDVFQRFFREEEAADKEGVGLGLYLANGIINKQKGYISVKSQKGKGTAFSVYLLS